MGFGNRVIRYLVERLQQLQRLRGGGLGAFDLELLVAMRDLDLQRRLDGAQVRVRRATQV